MKLHLTCVHVALRIVAPTCLLSICILAPAQSYTSGTAVATVVSESIPSSLVDQHNYLSYSEPDLLTLHSADGNIAGFGASATANGSGEVGKLFAYAYAYQPVTNDASYAEARGQSTIVDMVTVTGPQPVGTSVMETLTMVATGTYPSPDPNLEGISALAGEDISYETPTDSGSVSGSNEVGHSFSPLSLSFVTTIGARVQLMYDLDAWVYVNGENPLAQSELVDLSTGATVFANSSLPGVTLVSDSSYVYAAVPSPGGFATLGLGLAGLGLRRRRAHR